MSNHCDVIVIGTCIKKNAINKLMIINRETKNFKFKTFR